MKDPKVGERVCWWAIEQKYEEPTMDRWVKRPIGGGIKVRESSRAFLITMHSSACCRIRVKKRRRVWIHEKCFPDQPMAQAPDNILSYDSAFPGAVEFVEVLRKKK